MKGIILHGGYGTKLRPLTHTGPKQLIPIANKPISQYVLEDLLNAGIAETAIVLGNTYPEKVMEYFGSGERFGARIRYLHQDEPKGIAHAVSLCKEIIKTEPFVVYLGDNLIKGGIKEFVNSFENSDCDGMILLCQVKNPQRFGVARFNSKGKLVQLLEKPREPPSDYALTGIYFFRPVIFEMIGRLKPSWRQELEITDAIQMLLEGGYKVGYHVVNGWWKDTGTPGDILEANRLVLEDIGREIKGKVENDDSIQGRVTIGKDSVVKKSAVTRGPAIIGENTSIGADVYVGPYTSIGSNCIIENSEIENTIIMDNCTINISGRVTDSIIASHSSLISKRGTPGGKRFILGERTYIEI